MKKSYEITGVRALRVEFWAQHPQLARVAGRSQNQYPTDTRVAFVEFVDGAERNGLISRELASRATL